MPPMGMNAPIARQNTQFLLNVMHWLTGLLPDAWNYALAGALICPLPWLVAGGMYGGPGVIFTLRTAEAMFVYSIVGPAGAVFGVVFWWVHGRAPS